MRAICFKYRRAAAAATACIVSVLLAACMDHGTITSRATPLAPPSQRAEPLVLISIDGFRWDYLDVHRAPNLSRLASQGTGAEGLVPVFPTKTFPNHYTMATGLYPEHHGVVANNMYDPEEDAYFSISDSAAVRNPRWWGGEPIWITAEKQGLPAATYFWPGSEVSFAGVRPTIWKRYDKSVRPLARVREVLSWLDLPVERRPRLITLYFSDVDDAGHRFGPTSPEVGATVARIDSVLGELVSGLEKRGRLQFTNLMVVTDHGMAALDSTRVVFLDDYFNLDDVALIDYSPVAALRPSEGKEAEVYRALKNAHPHLQVYLQAEMPERWHYRDNPRIQPIICVADEGWSMDLRSRYDPSRYTGGTHGYDSDLRSMMGIFIAHGPAFKRGFRSPPVRAIDLYGLMAHVLGIQPAPNDGNIDRMRHILDSR